MAMSNESAGRWLEDLALLRLGPDAEILARQVQCGVYHPIGCLCPDCSELRAAVGRMAGRDKRIARLQEAKQRGKTGAEQAITGQARREAAARAEVTRELAGYGAYPYRSSGREAGECPAGCSPASTDCSHQYALRKAAAMAREQLAASPVVHQIAPAPEPALTPEQEILAGIYEPLGLDYGQLVARVPDQPPGTCQDCRTGPVFAGYQCWYCRALGEVTPAKPALPGSRRDRRGQVLVMLCLMALAVAFWVIFCYIAAGVLTP